MDVPSLGYMTYLALLEDGKFPSSGAEPPLSKLKLSTLLFDAVVVRNPVDIDSFVDAISSTCRMSTSGSKALCQMLHPVERYVVDYPFLGRPWQASFPRLSELASQIAIRGVIRDSPELAGDDRGLAHEAGMLGAGLLDGVDVWFEINRRQACEFVPDDLEREVLNELFELSTKRRVIDTFSEILSLHLPDLGHLPWDDVLALRQSRFAESFRTKVVEIHHRTQKGDLGGVRDIALELERSESVALIKAVKPNSKRNIFKSVVSNAPLPIPINPISIATAIHDAKSEMELERRYGWLYFLLEVGERAEAR
jgi:hypothetical protein